MHSKIRTIKEKDTHASVGKGKRHDRDSNKGYVN